MSMRSKILLGVVLSVCLPPLAAQAHWCNDMWSSSYNLVVRPASDTVTVPASGSGSLDIFVQNNFGYLLPSFSLTATMGSGTITATRKTQKVSGTLLPGENAQYTLAITKSGGGSVAIGDISFSVKFGNSGQSGLYPAGGGKAVMIRQTNGTLVPATATGIGTGVDQSRQEQYAAVADFSNLTTGLDNLMNFYCAGRGSWGAGSTTVITTACSGTATDCTKATRATTSGKGDKYDYTHLWAAVELGARKSALGTRLATLRTRLQCGAGDANLGMAGLAMMVLGYLGDDPTARTFLEGKAGTTDIGTVAKAALMLMSAADVTKYETDVRAGLSKGNFVAAACAAALGIAKLDDATVNSTLVPLAKWDEPDTSSNDALGLLASHMLALTAWDRRCWAANAADSGPVTFYTGDTPARTCSGATPTGGSTGSGGTTGSSGGTMGSSGGTTGSSGGARTGGTMVGGGSVATGGSTARGGTTGSSGGSTVNPAGGTTGTPTGGSTATLTGGSTATASGGTTARGGSTGMPSGGNTGTPSGGSTGTPTGGSTGTPTGGSTGTPTGGSTGMPTGGSTGTPSGGSTGTPTGGTPSGGGQPGNGGSSGAATATNSGSAGGCGYVPSGRATIPLGFLLAGVGLTLALRRRRR